MIKRAVCCIAVALFIATGCSQDPGLKDKNNAFKINGTWVTKAEVDQIAGQLHQQLAMAQPQAGMFGDVAGIRRSAARQVIANELISEEARKRHITFSDTAVTRAFEDFKKQIGPERFVAGLAASGKTQEDFKKDLPQALAVDSVVKMVLAKVDSVKPAQVKEFYDNNPEKFSEPGRIRAREIMIAIKKGGTAADTAAALKKAQDALDQINAGKDFVAISRLVSQDPNAKDGGDIGWFKHGDFAIRELEEAAFALKKNGVSPVIKSRLGFHIVQKTDEEAPHTVAFDEVKDRIRTMLEMQNRSMAVQKHADSLIAAAKIVYADTTYRPDTGAGLVPAVSGK